MAVKIESISVRDLGPIKSFKAKFGLLNLIYSKNEKGKTFLTEFIIRSLFKNISRWSYLRKGGEGKVTVSGLESNSIDFSPSSQKKLEDYWQEDEKGLPHSMAKLLVVKSGEAEIEGSEEGISKFLIKEILSGINILDRIDQDSNISKTVKSAKISNSQIIISQRGEGSRYNDTKAKLERIENLFEEIESQYAQGILKTYKIEEKTLQDKLELLNKAKRHEAYLISEKIKKLKTDLNTIPEEELGEVETTVSLYRNKKESHNRLQKIYTEASEKSKDFNWLESALSCYKDLISKTIKKPGKLLPFLWAIMAASCIILIITLILLNQKISGIPYLSGALVCLLGIVVVSIVHIKKVYDAAKQIGQSEELNKIKLEFKNRIGEELTDIALLESVLKEQREYNSQSKIVKEQIASLDRELRELHFSINQKIANLVGKEVEEPDWDREVKDLKQKNKTLKSIIDEEKEILYKLGVSETDYLVEDVGIKYSQEEYEKIQSDLENTSQKIKNQEEKLSKLKFDVCRETGDDPSISWEELIENLRRKRWETEAELKEITSEIVAGIFVHKVISELREEEDIKIQKGLESDTVLKPLRELTKRYNRLALDGDRLIISDEYENFDLKDLSTGAKEQVMLALRIGFSSRLLREDTLFLILDDAFQHSDWEKREVLVNKLADITERGWQIIYLTMDDHIKNLFDKVGKELKPDKYVSIELC